MEARQEIAIPAEMYQLAEQHHVGQPLGHYSMLPHWKRFFTITNYFLLAIAIWTILLLLVLISILYYQIIEHQATYIQLIEVPSLGAFVSLSILAYLWLARYVITRRFPTSFLICTDGFLAISRKYVDATHWNEVKSSVKQLNSGRQKVYALHRTKRRTITFSSIYKNLDAMIDIVNQRTLQEKRQQWRLGK